MSFAMTAAMVGGAVLMGGMTAMQNQAQNEAAQAQQESIAATTRMNYALKQQQEMEAKAAAGSKMAEEQMKRLQERGKMQAAQGESGVAGASPLRELMSSYVAQSLTSGSIISEGEAQQRSIALEMQSTYLQGLSEMNRLESQKMSEGAMLTSTLLSAGAGALAGYGLGSMAGLGATTTTTAGVSGGMLGTVPTGATFTAGGTTVGAGASTSLLGTGTLTTTTGSTLLGGMSATTALGLSSMLSGMGQKRY